MADRAWLERYSTTVYPALNLAVWLAALVGAGAHDVPFGVGVYVCVLVALCSSPLLLLKRLNDRYALLGIFMLTYFLFFGALDLQILVFGTDRLQTVRSGFLTTSELLILVGAVMLLFGYVLAVGVWGQRGEPAEERPAAEWPAGSLLMIGLGLWLFGTLASLYFQLVVAPSKLGASAAKGMASMGPALTFLVMLGQMMLAVGILMLSYGYAKYRGVFWTALIVVVVASQVAVGFLEDIKGQAILGGVLVIMTRTVVSSRVPKAWIAYMVAFLVVGFPIFQAYRVVAGERGLDRAQALARLDLVLDHVMSSRDKVTEGRNRQQSFLERSSSKGNLDLLIEHVGNDVPFLHGATLVAIPLAFVPRLLVPDKEDVSVGALFGKMILKSDSGVYISISHLGELYWNFGWPGVVFGMLQLGLLLGFVGSTFSLERGVTLTRVLILLATVQPLCLGFGGTMPISYIVWMRSMAAIGLLHLIFARVPTAVRSVTSERSAESKGKGLQPRASELGLPVALAAPVPRFRNLLR
jgi:hypothetical protein